MTTLVDDPALPRPGDEIDGRYLIGDVLGQGGFAVVYRATDQRRNVPVAVKVLDPIMSRRDDFASRFQREVELVSKLQHHHTIKVFDTGETSRGCLFLAMELLDGHSLEDVLAAQGQLDPERVRRVAVQILRSLNEAHGLGIIHRDLKPGNVFLAEVAGEPDYVKVLDFGIAKTIDESADTSLTATGQVMCSPHYVAPERVAQQHTVPASDLYSLGVMLIELLEGRPPYDADTPMMLAVHHMRLDEPVPMSDAVRDSALGPVLAKATAKRLDERFHGAAEMLGALEALGPLPGQPLAVDRAASNTSHERAVGADTRTQPEGRSISDRLPPTPIEAPASAVPRSTTMLVAVAAVVLLVGAVLVALLSGGADQAAPAATTPGSATSDPEPTIPAVPTPELEPAAAESAQPTPGGSPAPPTPEADIQAPAGEPATAQTEPTPEPAPAIEREPQRTPTPDREPEREASRAPAPTPEQEQAPEPERTPEPERPPEPEPQRAEPPEPTRVETEIVGERGARDNDAGGYVRERDAGSSGGGYFGR